MDEQLRAAALGEIATEAGIERASFLTDAARQFNAFLDANRERLRELGGLVLIDDEPEYLAITADGTFRSRTRYQDANGDWVAETEEIESGGEIVELYNPADLYSAFAEAARDEAGLEPEPTAAEDLLEVAGVASEMGVEQEVDREPDEGWVDRISPPGDTAEAARMLYDLALTYQERSQRAEARLLDQFQESSEGLAAALGDRMILDDEDERLWYRSTGAFEAEVVPETDDEVEATWQALTSSQDLVQFYDPTDLFGDLAEAIADQHPGVAPEFEEEDDRDDGDDLAAPQDSMDRDDEEDRDDRGDRPKV
jgi:hypothetical protein